MTDRELAAAAVCDPVRDELFPAARGEGATRNGAPMRLAGRSPGDAPATLDEAVVATFLHLSLIHI